jgi:hypothetical protein
MDTAVVNMGCLYRLKTLWISSRGAAMKACSCSVGHARARGAATAQRMIVESVHPQGRHLTRMRSCSQLATQVASLNAWLQFRNTSEARELLDHCLHQGHLHTQIVLALLTRAPVAR